MKHPAFILCALGLCASGQAATAPDFGPNVIIFDQATSPAVIQDKCEAIFKQQFSNQFGKERYAVLFKPGTYQADIKVGFYTHVAGLGKSPADVTINGVLRTQAFEPNGNVTQNFWRVCENFTAKPPAGKPVTWAVSQAAPMRRMHIMSELRLFIGGWASGGFLADSKIDGKVVSGSQQQWLSRNCDWGSWQGGVWNMVFMGVNNPPATGIWTNKQPHTVIDKTPLVQEKPFLYVTEAGAYAVFVPALKKDSKGSGWQGGHETGASVPIDKFHIAHAATDSAATLNAALAAGKHLLFTPGVYRLDDSLKIGRPDTIVLGIGLATLVPTKGNAAIYVADVDGVKLAGLLLDAGEKESPYLVQVGVPGSAKNHAANPTYLYDIFCRVGGAGAANCVSAVIINSSDVVVDHAWIWRADHGEGSGWTESRSKNGLVVNGANVTCYGLFVEHFQEYQTLWNGENGNVYFYQCEIPYDVPSTAAWSHDNIKGWAAYKVAPSVKKHSAIAMGIYSFFRDSPVVMHTSIEAPNTPSVRFKNIMNFWLKGADGSSVEHVINDTGEPSNEARREVRVANYPLTP
jgi:hypothetical protein